MRVDSPDDRRENPEICDECESETKELRRISYYGPGHQVEWLCPYCSVSTIKKEAIGRTLSSMFLELEKRLKIDREIEGE